MSRLLALLAAGLAVGNNEAGQRNAPSPAAFGRDLSPGGEVKMKPCLYLSPRGEVGERSEPGEGAHAPRPTCLACRTAADEPVAPKAVAPLFNGKDLSGLTVWVEGTKHEDPKKVFRVTEGQLHITGDGFGYAATDKAYKDYRVVVEYKWGEKTDGGKYVRNSGLLLNAVGPHGGADGKWMSCVECQLAQGCVGDLIVIRGKDDDGKTIPVSITSDVALGPDKRPRWKEGGTKTVFTNRQLWWNKHDPDYKELLDTRGKDDVESPLGEWTKVECVCDGPTITVIVNGTTVNKAYDVFPAAGKILLQCEGFELFVRKFEIRPLKE